METATIIVQYSILTTMLSELSTDQALDALCELTPYVANIASDEGVVGAVGKIVDVGDGLNLFGKGLLLVERMGEIVPALLRTHRHDVYGILSVLNERTVADIAAQPVMDTVQQVRELFQDEELLAFFRSSARRGQNEPSAPSAVSHA